MESAKEDVDVTGDNELHRDKVLRNPLYHHVCEHGLYERIDSLSKKLDMYEFGAVIETLHYLAMELDMLADRKNEDPDVQVERVILEIKPGRPLEIKKVIRVVLGGDPSDDEDEGQAEDPEAAEKKNHEKDIELVMSQTGCTREAAEASLAANQDDIVNAIMALDV